MIKSWKVCPLIFALAIFCCHCNAQEPVWRINLLKLGDHSESWGAATTLKFYGPFLVIYSGDIYSGSMSPKAVLTKDNGQLVSETTLSSGTLPVWDECPRTLFRKPSPAVNMIDCRGQMTIEQIGGIGEVAPRGDAEYYLHQSGKSRVLLFRANCITGDPRFVGDGYILLKPCKAKPIVVNEQGQKIYEMPKLADAYIAPNRDGSSFATQERDSSFLGQFQDTTDKKRMRVFRTSDGKQLFEYRLPEVEKDRLNDGRVALSDDGAMVAFIQGWELLAFRVPSMK